MHNHVHLVIWTIFGPQSMLVTVSEQCEKKLLAVKQEEKSGIV